MIPNPLHPAIVHFPVVLVVLLPLVLAGALWAIRRGASPRSAWAVPVAVAGALVLSAWVASRTGHSEEERVEAVVPEGAFKAHEEAAEQFLAFSGVLLLVAAVGLAGGVVGRSARYVTVAGALGLLVAGVRVGHTGGQLVYAHGAASAYASGSTGTPAGESEHGGDHDGTE
jgi:uncharacterized membrane protein